MVGVGSTVTRCNRKRVPPPGEVWTLKRACGRSGRCDVVVDGHVGGVGLALGGGLHRADVREHGGALLLALRHPEPPAVQQQGGGSPGSFGAT